MQITPMNVLMIALAIIVPVSVAALNSWVNITIKFAPDAAQAKRDAKAIFLTVVAWICNLLAAGMLIAQLVWPMSNGRVSILLIIMNSFTLFTTFVFWLVGYMMTQITNQMTRALDLIHDQAKMIRTLTENVKVLSEGMKTVLDSGR